MTDNSYLIALLPLLAFVMIFFPLRRKMKIASRLSIAAILLSWTMSVTVLIEKISGSGVDYESIYEFLRFPNLILEIGILVDTKTAILLVIVTTVGACIQIYSLRYMKDDPRLNRFLAFFSLFIFSILGLILAGNYFTILIFWELIGLSSYLLIGFWREKNSAGDALAARFSLLHKLSLYQVTAINPVMILSRWMWIFDNGIIDGAVNGCGRIVRTAGGAMRKLQGGAMQSYAMSILVLCILFGLWKYEFTFISDGWPTMTIVFILGLSALALLGRMAAKENQRQAESESEN